MKTQKLILIPAMLILSVFLLSVISASSVTVSLFYDATTSNALTIMNGDSTNIIVSADSIFENSMTVRIDVLDKAGALVSNILDTYTTSDSYSKYLAIGKPAYLGPGNYTIKATVTGASGQSDTDSLYLTVLTVTPGNTAPVITSAPIITVNETQNYNYQVTATDADGDALTYSLTQSPQNPPWLSINSLGLITGIAPNVSSDYSYAVTVKVSDGKDFDLQTFPITVKDTNQAGDTTPPFVNVIFPVSGATYSSNSLTFIMNTNEPTARAWYVLLSDMIPVDMTEITSTSFTKDVVLGDGSYEVVFYAKDLAGNVGTSDIINFSVKKGAVDTTPPVVTVISPTNNLVYNYSNINFEITANEALSNAWFSLDGGANVSLNSVSSTDFTKIVAVANGNHNVVFYAQDLAGNIGSSQVTFGVNVIIAQDTTPPYLEIFSPEEGITYTSYITTLSFLASDPNLYICWYSVDGGVTRNPITCNVSVIGLTSVEGKNNWTVYAIDLAGNQASKTVTFYVNIPGQEDKKSSKNKGARYVTDTDGTKQYLSQFAPQTIDDDGGIKLAGEQPSFWDNFINWLKSIFHWIFG